ncbi:MAG: mechanosensitive ion channel family protein, partial [Paracoccaceae bacterium]
MQDFINQLQSLGPLAVASAKALAVLVIGWIVAGLISRTIRRRVFANDRIDNTLGSFAASVVRWLILLVIVIAIMSVYGIEATSLVAVMGAATLAVGLALQGTLGDLAAGFMLILFRPYKLEQYVDIGGTAGTVKEINLFYTELATSQNVQIVIPNGRAWGSIITNYSHYDTRRGDLVFSIGYDDDADKAIGLINDLVAADERILSDPEPWVRVVTLGASSVDISARLWTARSDNWAMKIDMTTAVKEAFDKAGITIPYPHTV